MQGDGDQHGAERQVFRERPNRFRRISASWSSWFAIVAPISVWQSIPSRPAGARVRTGHGDWRGLHARAGGHARIAASQWTGGDDLSTSLVVEDAVTAAGSTLDRTPVGEVNVAVRMRELRAVVGGEGNGGVILPEVHLGRDAPLGIALILQLLAETGKPLSAIAGGLPRYVIVKDKLDRPKASLESVYSSLREAFADARVDTQDGLRLAWKDRWLHVRHPGPSPSCA